MLKIKTEANTIKPDYIMVGFFREDVNRNTLTFRDYFKPKYKLSNGKNTLTTGHIQPTQEYKAKIKIRLMHYLDYLRYQVFKKKIREKNYRRFYMIMQQMKEVSLNMDAKITPVYLPGKKHHMNDWVLEKKSAIPGIFLNFCKNGQVLCINLYDKIEKFLKKQPLEIEKKHLECHYSPPIHKLISDEIYEALQEESILH